MSAADAVLFMLSTSFSQDLYRRFIAPAASDERVLLMARMSAIAAGLAGLALALVLPTVVDALKIFYSLLTVALFLPVVAGLASTTPRHHAAPATDAVGTAITLRVLVLTTGRGVHGVPPVVIGLVASSLAFAAASLLWGER